MKLKSNFIFINYLKEIFWWKYKKYQFKKLKKNSIKNKQCYFQDKQKIIHKARMEFSLQMNRCYRVRKNGLKKEKNSESEFNQKA
jgi:predicted transcriptional regulator